MSVASMSRRRFLQLTGVASTGLVLGLDLGQTAIAANTKTMSFNPDVFLSIESDGLVQIISHRSEMGQGIRSSLPFVIADELGVDFERVSIKQGIGDKKYGSQNTDGSRSVRRNYLRFRKIGAVARLMLQQAAASHWRVDVKKVRMAAHTAVLTDGNKQLDFSRLVHIARTLPVPVDSDLVLKSDDELTYIGKDNMPMLDGHDIVTGKAIFGFDVQMDDLKIAVIARPPVLFGKPVSFDEKAALKVPGVKKVVLMPELAPPAAFKPLGGVAVIADNTWAAMKGRDALNIAWDHGDNAAYDSSAHEKIFKKALDASPHVARQRGSWDKAKATASKVLSEDYYVGGLAHATMEPPAATAKVTKQGIEIWACTQTPQSAQNNVMQFLGIAEENRADVTVNVTLLGGGFGRKSKPDFIVEAAYLAKQTGWPVKVLWTREDELQHGYYHSPSLQRVEASIDQSNKVTGWHHSMVNHPIGSTFNPATKKAGSTDLGQGDVLYDIPNIKIDNGDTDTHLRIGWLRSVTNINNAFAACAFVDELAYALDKDPADFMLNLLGKDQHIDFSQDGYQYSNYGDPIEQFPADTARMKTLIRYLVDKSGWNNKVNRAGWGKGIAAHRSFCSYCATVAEVAFIKGKIRVNKVYMAIDAGRVINPDRVRSQLEGSVIFSLSNVFFGDITAKKGIVQQSNFHNYPLARMDHTPEIETFILPSSADPAGVGEPGVPPVAPALTNAIFAATGKRYRRLPLAQYGIV